MSSIPYQPSALEMMEVLLRVICDKAVPCDAIFVHSECANDDLEKFMASIAMGYLERQQARRIVINGLSAQRCRELGLAYRGSEWWLQELQPYSNRGQVLLPPNGMHTGLEAEGLVRLASENNWQAIGLIAYPFHQLRCFLSVVAAMERAGVELDVHNATLGEIDWQTQINRIVMGGKTALGDSGQGVSSLLAQIEPEYRRIVGYAVASEKWTRHATIREALDYLNWRDQRRKKIS